MGFCIFCILNVTGLAPTLSKNIVKLKVRSCIYGTVCVPLYVSLGQACQSHRFKQATRSVKSYVSDVQITSTQ